MMILEKIVSLIKVSDRITILPHVSADGDSIGSSTALGLAIEKLGKKAVVYLEEEVPYVFGFMPGMNLIKVYDGTFDETDLVIALDTGDLDRLGSRIDIFKKGPVTVNIDHHPTNTMFADHNYVNTSSAAVSEIIYQMVKMSGIELDKDIATNIAVALITDTGGFRYSNTTETTHRIAGDLINNGADIPYIFQQVFDSASLGKTRLLGKAIDSLELYEDNQVAVITVTDKMLLETGAKEEDCEGIVNIGRNIRGVEAGLMFRQKEEGIVKVNFRSKDYLDVSAVAVMFSGGGHKRAAGCSVKGSLEEVKEKVLAEIRKVLVSQT